MNNAAGSKILTVTTLISTTGQIIEASKLCAEGLTQHRRILPEYIAATDTHAAAPWRLPAVQIMHGIGATVIQEIGGAIVDAVLVRIVTGAVIAERNPC